MYVRYALFALASMTVNVVAYILAPALAYYSVRKNVDVLPYPFSLLHTHDNTLDGGQKQGYEIGVTGAKLWWQRTCWIWRNPGYGFDAYVLGFRRKGHVIEWTSGALPSFERGGDVYMSVMRDADGKRYFTYRRNVSLPFGYFIKIWIGWNYVAYGGVMHQVKTHFASIKKEK